MSKPPDPPETVECPLCGAVAERGAIYSAKGLLRWRVGTPSLWSNVVTAFGGGELVGGFRLGAGAHAQGIRCRACRRIVLES